MRTLETFEEKVIAFWCKVQKSEGCWEWIGAKDSWGYGAFSFDGKVTGAHRVAWFLHYGTWPSKEADHMCYNRACVNVDHLRDVSHDENILARMISRICHRGHPLADPNLIYYKRGDGKSATRCKACYELKQQEARDARRARGLKKPGRKTVRLMKGEP